MSDVPTWNQIPFNPDATPQEKADDFDRQFAENVQAAYDKADQKTGPYIAGGEVQ